MKIAPRVGMKVIDHFYLLDEPDLKRDLLYFDRLAIDLGSLEITRGFAEFLLTVHDVDPKQALGPFERDVDFLVKYGLVEDIQYQTLAVGKAVDGDPEAESALRRAEEERNRGFEVLRKSGGIRPAPGNRTEIDTTYLVGAIKAQLLRARLAAGQMTTTECQYIPFFSGKYQPSLLRFGRAESVLRLVLDNLPVPSPDVEWSQLLEFRADPDSRLHLAHLRSWIADMATGSLNPAQIQDKLELAIAEYEKHLKRHEVKCKKGLLEIMVMTAAEVLDELLKGPFTALAGKLFQVSREHASLLEAERSAPGREVAYVATVRSRFGG